MATNEDRLSSPEHWAGRGTDIRREVDLGSASWFREQSLILRRLLSQRHIRNAVELGAFPGHILNWFCGSFGCDATAIEYVPSQARALELAFPSFEVLSGDFLHQGTFVRGRTWDLVLSFGLVEHWADLRVPLKRHAEMTARGGTCVVGIPIHSGVYGRLLRMLDADLHARHSHCSIQEVCDAFMQVAGPDWTVEECRTCEGVGFWNCGLDEWLKRRGNVLRVAGQKSMSLWHRTVTRLPAPASLRPNGLLIARRA